MGIPVPDNFREVNILHEQKQLMHTMTTISPAPNPRRSVRVPPLVSLTKDDQRYQRSALTEAEIDKMLLLGRSLWVAEAESLKNETLVFLIRRTHGVNDEVCGG